MNLVEILVTPDFKMITDELEREFKKPAVGSYHTMVFSFYDHRDVRRVIPVLDRLYGMPVREKIDKPDRDPNSRYLEWRPYGNDNPIYISVMHNPPGHSYVSIGKK